MSPKLLQLNFSFAVTPAEYQAAVAPLADAFAAVRGLRWKIWMINPDTREAGGLYLFDDAESLGAFLDGSLAAGVKEHPALSGFSVKTFSVIEDLTSITRGPIGAGAVNHPAA